MPGRIIATALEDIPAGTLVEIDASTGLLKVSNVKAPKSIFDPDLPTEATKVEVPYDFVRVTYIHNHACPWTGEKVERVYHADHQGVVPNEHPICVNTSTELYVLNVTRGRY